MKRLLALIVNLLLLVGTISAGPYRHHYYYHRHYYHHHYYGHPRAGVRVTVPLPPPPPRPPRPPFPPPPPPPPR